MITRPLTRQQAPGAVGYRSANTTTTSLAAPPPCRCWRHQFEGTGKAVATGEQQKKKHPNSCRSPSRIRGKGWQNGEDKLSFPALKERVADFRAPCVPIYRVPLLPPTFLSSNLHFIVFFFLFLPILTHTVILRSSFSFPPFPCLL